MQIEPYPDKETLRHQLQLEWQDHIQTRAQTWKSLEIEVFLTIGFVGADIKFDNIWVTIVLGIIFFASSVSGIAITIHHREGQRRKFIHIDNLEQALGLHQKDLLPDVHPPVPFKWSHVFGWVARPL